MLTSLCFLLSHLLAVCPSHLDLVHNMYLYSHYRSSSIQTYSGHTRTVNCVHCDARRIISASYDYKVKIWDFSGV